MEGFNQRPQEVPAPRFEGASTKSANTLEAGDYLPEYDARFVRKYIRGNQVVLILDDDLKLERLADLDQDFQVG